MEVKTVFPSNHEAVLLTSNATFIFKNCPGNSISSRKIDIPEIGAKWWMDIGSWDDWSGRYMHMKLDFGSSAENQKVPLPQGYEFWARFEMELENPDSSIETNFSATSLMKSQFETAIFGKESLFCGTNMVRVYKANSEGYGTGYYKISVNKKEHDFVLNCSVTILREKKKPAIQISGSFALSPAIKNFGQLLKTGDFSDFTFVFAGKEFKLHKNILSAASPYFATMFKSHFKENQKNYSVIKDEDPEIFGHLINFIYAGTLPENFCDVCMQLYRLAHLYEIKILAEICLEHVDAIEIDGSNALKLYKFAADFGIEYLFDMAWFHIKTKMLKITETIDRDPLTVDEITEFMSLKAEYDLKTKKFFTNKEG